MKKKAIVTTKLPNAKTRERQRALLEVAVASVRSALSQGRLLVWVDEAMTTQRTVMTREYSNLRTNIQIDLKDFNIKTTAVVAAISSEHGILLWKDYGKAVSSEDFVDFIKRLKGKAGKRQLSLYLDNASIHRAKVVKSFCEAAGVELIFNPPYFPQGNSIELLFAQQKRAFKALRTNQIVNGMKQDTLRTITLSYEAVSNDHIRNFIARTLKILGV